MRKIGVVLVLAALVAAGCGDASADRPEPAAATPSQSSATPSPVPTVDRATVQAKATAAMMAPDAVRGIDSFTFADEDTRPYAYDNFCGKGVTADRAGVAAAHRRMWKGDATNLIQVVHANASVAGTAVLDQIRTHMAACSTYRETCASHCAAITVLGPLDPGPLAGVDSTVGSCEKWEPVGDDVFVRCVVYLARGTTVTFLSSNGWTRDASTTMMRKVLPIAAAALART